MIIEIKDLPQDRKVKHITFDITFEEDGSPIVKSTPTVPYIVPAMPQSPYVVTSDTTANVPVTNLTAPTTPEGPNARAPKDIPPEMTNMEF